MTKLGFIGTGHLAGFFVEGLSRTGVDYEIMVSPRNVDKANELRKRFGVTVAQNQDIAESCDLIVVALLTDAAPTVLKGIDFRAGQTVLSVMAGVSLQTMIDLVSPADACIAMMPGVANAYNAGPSALHPDNPLAFELLSKLGPVHVYEDGAQFAVASVMAALSNLQMLMLKDCIGWFASKGMDAAEARRFVAEVLAGNTAILQDPALDLDQMARGLVTPGGLVDLGRKTLGGEAGWPQALEAIFQRVSVKD